MKKITVRKAVGDDAEAMALILREIGWSERRNSLPIEEVSSPIRELIFKAGEDPEGHTMYVACDSGGRVVGFTSVHWVPFVMLGSYEGYVSDLFVSPSASGMGAGSRLLVRR